MGNFPYPSSYITNGHGQLPAFPVRAACEPLAGGDDWVDADLLDGACVGGGWRSERASEAERGSRRWPNGMMA